MLLSLLGFLLAGCSGTSQEADLKCWAVASLASKGRPSNPDLLIMQSYYTGKLDAGDPEGKWTASAKAAQQAVAPAEFEELFAACTAPLSKSLERQLAAMRG
ncbi:hypothetical protein [uncultured Brevundimonas sp.]|uniref:hypothetical protein n=1 Tax=uncultured Brevundimonas sp. TaxID=213418 RepID=UPI0030EF713A